MSKALADFVAKTGQYGLELYGEALEHTQDADKALEEARRAYNRQPTRPPTEDDNVWRVVDEAFTKKPVDDKPQEKSLRLPRIHAYKKPLT